jgi:hypothetical protein
MRSLLAIALFVAGVYTGPANAETPLPEGGNVLPPAKPTFEACRAAGLYYDFHKRECSRLPACMDRQTDPSGVIVRDQHCRQAPLNERGGKAVSLVEQRDFCRRLGGRFDDSRQCVFGRSPPSPAPVAEAQPDDDLPFLGPAIDEMARGQAERRYRAHCKKQGLAYDEGTNSCRMPRVRPPCRQGTAWSSKMKKCLSFTTGD